MRNRKLIEPGKWFNEFDEEGNLKAAGYDASYYRILGYEPGELVINQFSDWTDRIHPEDAERVKAYAADVCAKHPEGMDHDIEYRMMTSRGYRWFHDYGHVTRREDGSVIRCDGVLFDIQDSVDKEDTHQALIENNRRILALEDKFAYLYEVELETGEYELYVNEQNTYENIRLRHVGYTDFFEDAARNVEEVLCPEDRELVIGCR